ncbi:MAG: hypothetical protein FWD17_02915 [Polyangiaceae bacterium]|nr:hypothetical protein [Polyangiaceae bacterium]
MFADVDVVSTTEIANAFELNEADARAYAAELGVAKVGTNYAWLVDDAEDLADELNCSCEADQGDDDDEGDEEEEGEEEESEE